MMEQEGSEGEEGEQDEALLQELQALHSVLGSNYVSEGSHAVRISYQKAPGYPADSRGV